MFLRIYAFQSFNGGEPRNELGIAGVWFRMRHLDLQGFTMSASALVEIRDPNFAYDKRPVLEGINMTIPKGSLIAIMGLSGCGKSALLRHIGGSLKPTGGCVKVGGEGVHQAGRGGL